MVAYENAHASQALAADECGEPELCIEMELVIRDRFL
jgi:hypothetical protein